MSEQETPLGVRFINFIGGPVWVGIQTWFERRIAQEKDEFFSIKEEDEALQRDQRRKVQIIEELARDLKVFVLNSAKSKEKP